MPRKFKIIAVSVMLILSLILSLAGWWTYRFFYTLEHIPEAYAAWDTGTLFVEYLSTHDNQWPTSWEDLLADHEATDGRNLFMRGSGAGDLDYARSLQELISVDWDFDIARIDEEAPIKPWDGDTFPVLYENPNETIRDHLRNDADN